jgi:hypothetical protein
MRKKLCCILVPAAALMATPCWAAPADASLVPGTISLEVTQTAPELRSSTPGFVGAVGQALADKGFTVIDEPGHAGLVADLAVSRDQVGAVNAKVPRGGRATTSGGAPDAVGANMTFALPSAKNRVVPLQLTRLEVHIRKRGDAGILWQGTAITVRPAGTRKGEDAVVASDLIGAILHDYPAPPEGIISVP